MNIKKRLQILFISGGLLFALIPSTAIASEIAIEAFTDKTSLTMKDRLVLTVKISGEVIGSLPEPYEISYDGFDIMRRPSTSSNFSWINGRISSSKTITYILMPKSEGSFLVGKASIEYKGEVFASKPVEVKVAAAAPVAAEEEMPGQTTTMMADPLARILVSATLDKDQVYMGEAVLYTFSFFRKIRLWENPEYNPPTFADFWAEDLPRSTDQKEVIIRGERYLREDIKKVLYPAKEGLIKIGSTNIVVKLDPFARPTTLTTEPLELEVLPLPPEPEGFQGAVGNFSISTDIEATKVKDGEPVTVKVKIAGIGNINAISPPTYEESEFLRGYEPKDSVDISTLNDMISGTKTFEFLFITLKPGNVQLPIFKFTYFDPAEELFKTLHTKEINLTVLDSGRGGVLSSDPDQAEFYGSNVQKKTLRPIHMKSELDNWNPLSYISGAHLVMLIFPPFILLIAIFLKKIINKRAGGLKGIKRALEEHRKAGSLINPENSRDFFSETAAILNDYFVYLLDLPSAAMPKEEIHLALSQAGMPRELLARIEKSLSMAEMGRFSPARYGQEEMKAFHKEVKDIIHSCEGLGLRRPGR
ncbi:MAG: BatD family protein [bacterium]|nr:BatD family protein [bacterium]